MTHTSRSDRHPRPWTIAWRSAGRASILSSTPFAPELFTNVGIDPTDRHIVVVKSAQHFHAGFAPIAADILHVGTPGVVAPDYRNLDFHKVVRPRWPFDEDEPDVRLID